MKEAMFDYYYDQKAGGEMKRENLIIRKSFAISHNNGDIWAENLDALYDFNDVVESKFLDDIKIIKRPSTPSIIAINLSETVITKIWQ